MNYPNHIPEKLNKILPKELQVKDCNNLTDQERLNLEQFILQYPEEESPQKINL